jgi:chemotaxis protein MotB
MIVGLVTILATACGIPKDEHLKVQQDLASTQAAFQSKEQQLAKCEDDLRLNTERLQVCMTNFTKTESDLKNLDAEYNDTWAQLQAMQKANDLRQKAMDELLQKFEQLIKSGKLTIGINDGRMVIQLSSDVLFEVGKAKLSKVGQEAVKEVVDVLKTIDGRKFQVAGHTDNTRGRGKENPNWTLSYQRARSVFDVMVKNEFDESLLSLAAYAEYSPVASNETKEGRQQNRRIEIVLLPTSDELPLKQLRKIQSVQETIATDKPVADPAPVEPVKMEEKAAE